VTGERVQQAVRALYKTGFFSDVQISRQGNILVITVKERPAISKIELKGNKDLKSEDLPKGLKDIGLAEGEPFDRLARPVTQERPASTTTAASTTSRSSRRSSRSTATASNCRSSSPKARSPRSSTSTSPATTRFDRRNPQ
jgi:outer membrane protein assembly factor BamA